MEIADANTRSRTGERTLGLSWPLIVALLTLSAVLLSTVAPKLLNDPDTYWHLATGQMIIEQGRVPNGDPFSHSMPGVPWTAHEWLAEVLMAVVHQLGGWPGLAFLAAACYATVLAALTRFLLVRMEPVHALLFVGLAAGMMSMHLLARPHVLAWPLLTLWVGGLVNSSEAARRPSWWLLGVMLVWANLHGSFTLGLAFSVALACDAIVASPATRRWAVAQEWLLFVVLAVMASMATPSGWQGLAYTLHVMSLSVSLSLIGEWASPNFHRVQVFEVWMLLILAMALSGRLRLPLVRMLIVLGLVHLALKHQRNIAILGMLSPLLLATPLARLWYGTPSGVPGGDAVHLDRWFRALAAPAAKLTSALSLLATSVVVGAVLRSQSPGPAAHITPSAALQAARAAGVQGPVLNGYNFGGFLIHQGVKVAIDGRADMYGDEFMKRNTEALQLKDAKLLPALLDDYRIGWTMLPPATPAIALLDVMPGWHRVYADDTAVVHKRVRQSDTR